MEWIKCSERLPESKDDLVLVYSATGGPIKPHGFPTGGYDAVHIQDYFDDITSGLDKDGKQLYTKWYLSQGITHWMPFPEPPTE
ncbi:DUF551 domain-containing protein [Klebsiella quasipneumoniae]|uniref:DUF551 domain-containing protein n=1 Tax=Klebsiella quasipneumoniae TaxID=1463165 RepID=UPI001033CE3B|nr:DUF551 domain-containing protein [Klebsiella quasipneumoniae]